MSTVHTTANDVVSSVKALQAGVDALARIAAFGGVQGDWAIDALREINDLVCTPNPIVTGAALTLVPPTTSTDPIGASA